MELWNRARWRAQLQVAHLQSVNVQEIAGKCGAQSANAQRIADLIEFVQTNARGIRCGERHHKVRHANIVVDQARQLRASGMTYRAIGEALGVNFRTVWCWLTGRRRNSPAVRLVARRVKSTATDTTSVLPPNVATPT